MNAVLDERPMHPGEEGSPQACAILLALRRNGGAATAEHLRRLARVSHADLADALMGLMERRRVWFDQGYAGIGAWRLVPKR